MPPDGFEFVAGQVFECGRVRRGSARFCGYGVSPRASMATNSAIRRDRVWGRFAT
jgi:hypothetical protein